MNDNSEVDDWAYDVFDRNTPPSDFGPFEDLVNVWKSKWVGNDLPAWRDFDFDDFAGWYGSLIVEDIIPEGNGDVRFRLWGTKVTDLFHRDLTGKCMSEVEDDWFDPEEYELVTRIVEEGVIIRSRGHLGWEGREYRKIITLELPLAEDGKSIDKILCGVCQAEPEDE